MRSIQDVGIEILSGKPQKFYCFVGSEYGIKQRYIDILRETYDGRLVEYDSVNAVFNLMNRKHVVPLQPSVYVVRYDMEYISRLCEASKNTIKQCNIIGTIVCVYEDTKSTAKLSKYLDDYIVSIDPVDAKFVEKYISTDFPGISHNWVHNIAAMSNNYGKAKIVSRCIASVDPHLLDSTDTHYIRHLFMLDNYSYDTKFQLAVGSRAYDYLCNVVDTYEGSYDNLIYEIMSTVVEIDKLRRLKYSESPLFKVAKQWTAADICNMYDQCYQQLIRLRTVTAEGYCSIMYLIGLLKFEVIPRVGDMK